jgi:hypothetical protein
MLTPAALRGVPELRRLRLALMPECVGLNLLVTKVRMSTRAKTPRHVSLGEPLTSRQIADCGSRIRRRAAELRHGPRR